jgi:H/ACA ribonucleoprotein complex subunit 4
MEWYTREEAEPGDFGEMPEKRDIDDLLEKGFVIVDKPFGPTSNQVSHWVKEEMNLEKTGHFGTLDPNATGILPVGLDSGTRVQDALSRAKKEYVFEAELRDEKDEEEIREKLQEFKGVNEQTPPEHSAVKKEEREREVYEIELIETRGKNILGRVNCESGFYVRVLIEQLGEKLRTDASMEELRRTQQGGYKEEEAETLQDIVDAYRFYKDDREEEKLRKVLHPIEHAVKDVPKIVIKDSAVNAVANGSNLGSTGISKLQDGIKDGDQVAIMTLKGELVALAEAEMTSEEIYDHEDTAATLEKVFMDPSKYPRRWKQD